MIRWFLVASFLLFWPTAVFAHSGQGPHGGPLADAGPYYVELMLKDKQLSVFIFDDKSDQPIATKDAHGTATVLVGQDKETVTLQPGTDAGGNTMSGQLGLNAGSGARIVVLIQFPGKPSVIARFSI